MKTFAFNKRARFDYEILETFEAGIALKGFEVKAIRANNVSLKGAYVVIQNTGARKTPEAWIINMHIAEYKMASIPEKYEPTRSRKLLLHKREITRLLGKQREKGLTLVPISLYTKGGKIKLEFGLGRGKKRLDKRESIKERESNRRIQRAMRGKV